MADFSINSTQLSDAQGRGTQALSPVEERVSNLGPGPLLQTVGDIFAKGLVQNRKDEIEQRKNTIVGEYINNQKVYDDALTSGQWNASQVAAASRANYSKFMAAYPEYSEHFSQARSAWYGGSETGEAQKQLDVERDQRNQLKMAAQSAGFTFYSGMSKENEDAQIAAYQKGQYESRELEKLTKIRAEARAEDQHQQAVNDHVAKEKTGQMVSSLVSTNIDAINSNFKNIFNNVTSGKMTYEEAMMYHETDINRLRLGLNTAATLHPELAAPWIQTIENLSGTMKQLLDPKPRSERETTMLQNQLSNILAKSQIAQLSNNPRLVKAVTASKFFPNDVTVGLMNSDTIKNWMSDLYNDGKSGTQIVGTQDDKQMFEGVQKSISRITTLPAEQKDAATQEAVTVLNNVLNQTTKVGKEADPRTLKQAAAFYASPEFGRMALEGKIDKQTAANAQYVFQTQYDPAVRQAIVKNLDDFKISQSINVKTVGGRVVFEVKPKNVGTLDAIGNSLNPLKFGQNADDALNNFSAKQLKSTEEGLNQLIRMHAHLEGTTDYAKYWEDRKHIFMPTVYPDPAKLKPGQVITATNGKKYKYLGGNFNDIEGSYMEVKDNGRKGD